MKNTEKFEHLSGYGHSGIRVNLTLGDEYVIGEMVARISVLDERIKGAKMDFGSQDPKLAKILGDAQYALWEVSNLLKKMTTIKMVESDIFSQPKEDWRKKEPF